jgi:hypothetical protein
LRIDQRKREGGFTVEGGGGGFSSLWDQSSVLIGT